MSVGQYSAYCLISVDPAGRLTLILIKISMGQPAGSKKLNNILPSYLNNYLL